MTKKVDITNNCRILFIFSIICTIRIYFTTEHMQDMYWIVLLSFNFIFGSYIYWGGRIIIPYTHRMFFYFVSITFMMLGPIIIFYSIVKHGLKDIK